MAARLGPQIAIEEPRERLVASVRIKSHPSQLRQSIASAQDQVLEVIGTEGLAPAGPMFTRYHRVGPIADLEVGVPLTQTIRSHPSVINSTLPGGPAVHAISIGSRAILVQTVRALNEYLSTAGLTPTGGYWEYYLTEPLPGLDVYHVGFFLPVVGVNANRRQPAVPKKLVAIEICTESATKSIFARRGPRWEEGVIDVDTAKSPRSPQTNPTTQVSNSRMRDAHDEYEPEA